jgi:hypothetical protein
MGALERLDKGASSPLGLHRRRGLQAAPGAPTAAVSTAVCIVLMGVAR